MLAQLEALARRWETEAAEPATRELSNALLLRTVANELRAIVASAENGRPMADPIDEWLAARPERWARIMLRGREWRVALYSAQAHVAHGTGATLDVAFADALNDIMRREGAHAEEG